MRPLQGKVAVISGAGRGIGRAIAVGYARAGAAVCCTARTATQLAETCGIIAAAGGQALPVACDVVDPASVAAVFERAAAEVSYAVVWVAGRGAGTAQVQTVATRSRFVVPALPNGMPAIATID